MQRSRWIISVLSVMGLLATGCQNKVHDENVELHRQNRELQSEKDRLQQDLAGRPDPAQLASMQQELAARDVKIADLQAQLRQAPASAGTSSSAFSGIEVTRDERTGTLTVNLPGDVLFDSGLATLKPSARTTLTKVVSAIKKDYPGKKIIVNGHTDTDPISRSKDKWEDNLDLSAARARAVEKYLAEEGIDAKLIGMRAYGDTLPKGSKPASRRVEIVVATR